MFCCIFFFFKQKTADDMRISDWISDVCSSDLVKKGETIRFVIRNGGELLHEFNIGTPAMHAEHQKEMAMMVEQGMLTSTGMNHDMSKMDHSKMGDMDHSKMSMPMKQDRKSTRLNSSH